MWHEMSYSICKLIFKDAILHWNLLRFHFVLKVHSFALADRECVTRGTQRQKVGELGYSTFLSITSFLKQLIQIAKILRINYLCCPYPSLEDSNNDMSAASLRRHLPAISRANVSNKKHMFIEQLLKRYVGWNQHFSQPCWCMVISMYIYCDIGIQNSFVSCRSSFQSYFISQVVIYKTQHSNPTDTPLREITKQIERPSVDAQWRQNPTERCYKIIPLNSKR